MPILDPSSESAQDHTGARQMSTVARTSRTQHHRTIKQELTETTHPAWVERMIENLEPDWNGVLRSPLFEATGQDRFPEESWRHVVLEFFGVVEGFPKYMGVYLAKTTFGRRPGDILARD